MSLFNQGGNATSSFGTSSVQPNSGATKTAPLMNKSSKLSGSEEGGSTKILKDLLESANNFPKSGLSDLGSIQLTIPELQKKTNSLRHSQKEPASFTRAHYLLASSGVSADDIETELNSLGTQDINNLSGHIGGGFGGGFDGEIGGHKGGFGGGFGGGFDFGDNKKVTSTRPASINVTGSSLDSYLNTKKDENILSAIESSLASASKDFDTFVGKNVAIDWKARKDFLRKSFGVSNGNTNNTNPNAVVSSGSTFSWTKTQANQYNLLAPLSSKQSTSFSSKQLTRERFESHAQIVYQLNEARLTNSFFPLALSFEEVSKANSDLKSGQVGSSWKILVNLAEEKSSKINQEQKFFSSYCLQEQGDAQELNRKLIKTSKAYLESQFYDYIDQIYNKDDDKDKLPPTNINKVTYFINKVARKDKHSDLIENTLNYNGVPIWALIFYLIRAGLYQEALEVVSKNASAFNKFDKNFPIYLKKFVDVNGSVLPSDLNDRLQTEFTQQFGFVADESIDSFDAYKYSVFKIIGKCDLSKKALPQAINLSIEDWLWFHLSLINESSSTSSSSTGSVGESQLIFENYSLGDLQKKIIQLGPKKFNSSSNNPLYLKALVMVGLFELAVQFTYENINECDAVHLAIGLCYYGLLRVTTLSHREGLMHVNSHGECEINFSRLLGSYTRTFKISDPKVAAQYSILIAMANGGNCQYEIETCHEALRELILASREFKMLLGELNSNNGERISGLLEKQRNLISLPSLENFYHKIIEISANRCEEEGRIFDALLLYQLAQEFNTVVILINKLLSEILSTTELDKPLIQFGNYENVNGEKHAVNTIDNNIILLSQHIIATFNKNTFILDNIEPSKKDTVDLLLQIVAIRETFLNKEWDNTLAGIVKLGIIPIDQAQDLLSIRKSAELVHTSLDDNIIKVIPSLLIIIMTSLSQLNYTVLTQRYASSGSQKEEVERIHKMAKNSMIYAGMVQYKMPRETYSLLVSLESSL
ncbi:nucleoporin Nic96p [[Candida] anglica]|uniref:Nuclear pore protein n=1 Tax=[Candida] anglica TaxID=148631 RepID=A0ABP0EM22_9ASCO